MRMSADFSVAESFTAIDLLEIRTSLMSPYTLDKLGVYVAFEMSGTRQLINYAAMVFD